MLSSCSHKHPALAQSSSHCRHRQHTIILKSTNYDHPALYTSDDAFAERSYWDNRYREDPTTFEWYRGYSSLKPVLRKHLPQSAHVLQLGVGTSRLQVDMADDGYSKITSIDYSPVAIERLQRQYPGYPGLHYAVADARCMPQYDECSYGGVLDKGTLDALLCGDNEAADAAALLGEVWRLLQPGAAYVLITSASPKARLPYMLGPVTPWSSLLVYEVGQQGVVLGPVNAVSSTHIGQVDSSSSSSSESVVHQCNSQLNAPANSGMVAITNQCRLCGIVDPADEAQPNEQQQFQQHCVDKNLGDKNVWGHNIPAAAAAAAIQLPRLGYSHLVYVCYK